MTELSSFEHVLACLQDRDLVVDKAELLKASNSESGSSLQNWVEEHLVQETLLTKDELNLYATLQKSGEAEALAASLNHAHTRKFDDQAIQKAIEELRKSTAAIEKQTESISLQQQALVTLCNSNQKNAEQRSAVINAQNRTWETNAGQMGVAIDDISTSLAYQAEDLVSQSIAASVDLSKTASGILQADDKLLSNLNTLCSSLYPVEQGNEAAAQCVRDLCARLMKHTVEWVRTRLDRVYLTTIYPKATKDSVKENPEVLALLEELESLYSEIVPVAQMSAEQQYLGPALKFIRSEEMRAKDRLQESLGHISTSLAFVIDRLRSLVAQTDILRGHGIATKVLTGVVRTDLESTPGNATKLGSNPPRGEIKSPVRPHRSTRRRSSTNSVDKDTTPEQLLLRNFSVDLSNGCTTDRAVAATLQEALTDRSNKVTAHERNLQILTEEDIGNQLQDAFLTLHLLRDELLNKATGLKVDLIGDEIETAIVRLETDLGDVKHVVKEVDFETLRQRNTGRDVLVDRWAR